MSRQQEAVAVLFSCDTETNDCTWDVFRESEDDVDPITRAEGLMMSCRDDFPPTRLWSVTGNDRARELRSQRILNLLGMGD